MCTSCRQIILHLCFFNQWVTVLLFLSELSPFMFHITSLYSMMLLLIWAENFWRINLIISSGVVMVCFISLYLKVTPSGNSHLNLMSNCLVCQSIFYTFSFLVAFFLVTLSSQLFLPPITKRVLYCSFKKSPFSLL